VIDVLLTFKAMENMIDTISSPSTHLRVHDGFILGALAVTGVL